MGAFSDVGSELSKELNEQKVIRRIAKARGESAVERGSRCREAKDVVQRMQSFEKEKNDVEKHFEDSKKGLVWEIKKLKNVLFGWGRGGGAKKKRLDLEFKISEEDRMGIGTSYLEVRAEGWLERSDSCILFATIIYIPLASFRSS